MVLLLKCDILTYSIVQHTVHDQQSFKLIMIKLRETSVFISVFRSPRYNAIRAAAPDYRVIARVQCIYTLLCQQISLDIIRYSEYVIK